MVAYANAEALRPHRARPASPTSGAAAAKRALEEGRDLGQRAARAGDAGRLRPRRAAAASSSPRGPPATPGRAPASATRPPTAAGMLAELAPRDRASARTASARRAPTPRGSCEGAGRSPEEDRRGGDRGGPGRQGRVATSAWPRSRADLLFHLLVALAPARVLGIGEVLDVLRARGGAEVKALASTTTSACPRAGASCPSSARSRATCSRRSPPSSPLAARVGAGLPAGERRGRRAGRALLVPRPRPGGHGRSARQRRASCSDAAGTPRGDGGLCSTRCASALGPPAAEVPGLPRFTGGAVGYLTYDAVRLFERIPDRHAPRRRSVWPRSPSTARSWPSTTCASASC